MKTFVFDRHPKFYFDVISANASNVIKMFTFFKLFLFIVLVYVAKKLLTSKMLTMNKERVEMPVNCTRKKRTPEVEIAFRKGRENTKLIFCLNPPI